MKALVSLDKVPIIALLASCALLFALPPIFALVAVLTNAGLGLIIFAPEIAKGAHSVIAAMQSPAARRVASIAGVAALGALGLALCVDAAYAADAAAAPAATTVSIPWGDMLSGFLTATGSLFILVISWLAKSFAPPIAQTFLTNDVITKAVNYAIAAVEGAARGKTADLTITNDVLAMALEWLTANYPTIAKALGDRLEPLLIAELVKAGVVPAEASAATLGAAA